MLGLLHSLFYVLCYNLRLRNRQEKQAEGGNVRSLTVYSQTPNFLFRGDRLLSKIIYYKVIKVV